MIYSIPDGKRGVVRVEFVSKWPPMGTRQTANGRRGGSAPSPPPFIFFTLYPTSLYKFTQACYPLFYVINSELLALSGLGFHQQWCWLFID